MRYVTAGISVLIATLVLIVGSPTTAASAQGAVLSKPFSQCRLSDPMKLRSIEAECAEITVPESDTAGSGRITLSVARIPAINRSKQIDPIILLAGGPGQGAQLAFTATSPTFARAGRDRDILLIDQRGTGRSNLLSCDVETRTMSEALAVDANAFVQANER